MAIDPSRSVPQDVATVQSLQSTTEESAKAAMRAPVDAAWGQARGSVFGNLLGFVVGGIGQALRGIFTPGGLFAPIGEAAQEIRDGQLDLEGRTDLLSPLLDYGSAFQPAPGVSGGRVIPFTAQLGPMRGCRLESNGIRLLDKGLWDIRVHQTINFDINVFKQAARLRLEVLRPNGTVYSEQESFVEDISAHTHVIVSSVVVPEAGYLVRARVYDISSNRQSLGGPRNSRLSVQHISREVEGYRGNETSD